MEQLQEKIDEFRSFAPEDSYHKTMFEGDLKSLLEMVAEKQIKHTINKDNISERHNIVKDLKVTAFD